MYNKKYKEFDKVPEGHIAGNKEKDYVLPEDTKKYVHAELTQKGVTVSISEEIEGDKVKSTSNKKPFISLFEANRYKSLEKSGHFNKNYHSVKILHQPINEVQKSKKG